MANTLKLPVGIENFEEDVYKRQDEEYHNVTELLLKKSKKWNRNTFTRLIYLSLIHI